MFCLSCKVNEARQPKKKSKYPGFCGKCYDKAVSNEPENRAKKNKSIRDRRLAKKLANPEQYAKEVAAYNQKNNVKKSLRKYQSSDKKRAAAKAWEKRNPEKVKANRKKMKQKKRGDLVYRFAERISKTIRASLNKLFIEKPNATFLMLGVSQKEYCDHLSKYLGKPCEECRLIVLTIDNCHIDHIIPRCSAETLADVLRLNKIENLRCICPTCNVRKSAKLPESLEQNAKVQ